MAVDSITTIKRKPRPMTAGERNGRLVAIEFVEKRLPNAYYWKFRCDCGQEKIAQMGAVRTGSVRSCGCLAREQSGKPKTHGMSHSPEYLSWKGMIARCTNPKATGYENYGGRGIKICDRWMTFANFYADMGERPPGTTLDRHPNNDGNYESGNCRWASDKEQGSNQRTNRLLSYQGREITLADAAVIGGMSTQALWQRLKRGLSIEDALSIPFVPRPRKSVGLARPERRLVGNVK